MHPARTLLVTLTLLLLAGCEDDSSDDSGLETGYLTGIPIEGLRYHTSPGSIGGMTGPGGSFNFLPHDQVTFFLGDIRVGEVRARQRITLKTMELEMRGHGVRRLASDLTLTHLLLSLDVDETAANGVVLTAETHAAFSRASLGEDRFAELQDVIYNEDILAMEESRALRTSLARAGARGLVPIDTTIREYGALSVPGVYSAESTAWRDSLESDHVVFFEVLAPDGRWLEYAFSHLGLGKRCEDNDIRCTFQSGHWSYDHELDAVIYDAIGLWSNVATMYNRFLPAPAQGSADLSCGLNIDFDGGWQEIGRDRDLWLCVRNGTYVITNNRIGQSTSEGVLEDNFSLGTILWTCNEKECAGGVYYNLVTSKGTAYFRRGEIVRAVLLPGRLWEEDRLKIVYNDTVTIYERAYY